MTPSRLRVIRLFESDKIEKDLPIDINSNAWISLEKEKPDFTDVFYVKNKDQIFKSIYLHAYPIPGTPKWWHIVKDEYIDESDITHWMIID